MQGLSARRRNNPVTTKQQLLAHPRLMFSCDAVTSGAPDPAVFAGQVPVQARERKGTFFTTWSPLAMAPIVAPPPPTTFLELLPTLDQWERDLFDTCHFLVPCHKALHIVCTEPLLFASDGGAASPKASFGWVLSTNQGQRLLHVSGPAYEAHPNSYSAEGYGILSVMRFLFRVQSFVTETLSDSRLCCHNKSMVASSHKVPAEWKRTPNSTQTSDYDVLAEIWATRDLLPVTVCPAVLHIKGHQDKKTACEQLPLPAQLNVDADKLAGDCVAAHPNTDYTVVPILPTGGVQLHLPAGTITCNMKKEVSMARTTEPMKQHMIKKHGWDEETFLDIDWEAHRRGANRHHKRRTTLKHWRRDVPRDLLSCVQVPSKKRLEETVHVGFAQEAELFGH